MNITISNINRRICLVVIILLLISFVAVSCKAINNPEPTTEQTAAGINPAETVTDNNADVSIFDWEKGASEKEIFDYLEIPAEERKEVSAVFENGRTIQFRTNDGFHRITLDNKQKENSQIYSGESMDSRFNRIHSFLYNDILKNEVINIEDKIDLKGYEGLDRTFSDYCEGKLLIYLQNQDIDGGMTSWGVYIESAFPTYLYFDLENYSYEFIRLSDIIYTEDLDFSISNAVLVGKDKILITHVYEPEKCKALIYDLNTKKIIEEYEMNGDYHISKGAGNCRVSPDGRYLLYEPLGNTRYGLCLYDMERHKEYKVINPDGEESLEEILTYYNWDTGDGFFYVAYNRAIEGRIVYLKKAGEYN